MVRGISQPYKYHQTSDNNDNKLITTSIFVPAEPSKDMGEVRKMDNVLISHNNKSDAILLNILTKGLITLTHVSFPSLLFFNSL